MSPEERLALTRGASPDNPRRRRAVRSFAAYTLAARADALTQQISRVPCERKHGLADEASALVEAAVMLRQVNEDNPIDPLDLSDTEELGDRLRWKRRVQECLAEQDRPSILRDQVLPLL